MPTPLDFFIHVPKAAGTTMLHIIEAEYPPGSVLSFRDVAESDYPRMLQQMKDSVRIVAGHLHFGFARFFPKPCRSFAILRDPVERLLSLYYFIGREKSHPAHEAFLEGRVSLEKLARRQGTTQARFIAGYALEDAVTDDRLLAQARENLANSLVAFGLTERFDESLLLFNEALGWNVRRYARANSARNRPSQQARSAEEIEVIRAHSAVDLALYEFAQKLFAERLAMQSADFAKRLAELRRKSKITDGLSRAREGMRWLRKIAKANS